VDACIDQQEAEIPMSLFYWVNDMLYNTGQGSSWVYRIALLQTYIPAWLTAYKRRVEEELDCRGGSAGVQEHRMMRESKRLTLSAMIRGWCINWASIDHDTMLYYLNCIGTEESPKREYRAP
jgi:hypothetical protein